MVQTATRLDQNIPSQNETFASQLAAELRDSKPRKNSFPIPARLKELNQFLQTAYNYFDQATKTQVAVSNASEWLLDNFYVIEQALRVVEDDLPADYYSRLPKVPDGSTRIFIVASAINREAPRLDVEQIRYFIQTFQRTTALQTGELWALPLMLRLSMMETLAEGLADITKLKWNAAPQPTYWTKLHSGSDVAEADSEVKVINSIINLRLIATIEWKEFFEATSILEQTLHRDPANIYAYCDFETRNQYRSIIEELARGSVSDEGEIASQAISLAEMSGTAREQHVGYYLIAEGRAQLEKLIRYHPSLRERFLAFIRNNATSVYLGSIVYLTILLISAIVLYAIQWHASPFQVIVISILAIIPASAVIVDLINWLVGLIVPPRTLPKLNLEDGVPAESRTMIVIPALLGTERDVTFLLHQIELHFVANSDPNLFFALLTDFADAPEEEMPQDEALIAQTTDAIHRLNERYGNGSYHPFYLFHRKRTWNPGEDCWMGWERKRGKLEEFNKLLRGDTETSYTTRIGDLSILESIR